nr:unnamed protein product [Callosobruchus analis]
MLLLVIFVTLGTVLANNQDECRGISPIPTDKCDEYVLIHKGKPYTHKCPDGLLFNKKRLLCDLPENTDCLKTNDCIKNGIECPKEDSDKPLFKPLPNCNEFCQCSNGIPYVRHCPKHLHWNPTLNTCDFPENAGCPTRTTTSAPNTTSVAPETITPRSDEDIGTEICLKEGVGWYITCQLIMCHGNEPGYQATSNCSTFCQCANGRPYLKVCKGGLHFNSKVNVCDWPENAGCPTRTTTSAPNTTSVAPEATTPKSDEDVGTEICLKEGVVCHGNEPAYQATSNCSKFCQCANGRPFLKVCKYGLHFNAKLNVCDWPENAGCKKSSTTENTITDSSSTENNSTNFPKTTESTTTNSSTTTENNLTESSATTENTTADCRSTTDSSTTTENITTNYSTTTENTTTDSPTTTDTVENDCQREHIGCPRVDPATPVYRAVSGCTQFCQCSNGTPFLFDCPGGTLFNEKLNVCDWPYNVKCRA